MLECTVAGTRWQPHPAQKSARVQNAIEYHTRCVRAMFAWRKLWRRAASRNGSRGVVRLALASPPAPERSVDRPPSKSSPPAEIHQPTRAPCRVLSLGVTSAELQQFVRVACQAASRAFSASNRAYQILLTNIPRRKALSDALLVPEHKNTFDPWPQLFALPRSCAGRHYTFVRDSR